MSNRRYVLMIAACFVFNAAYAAPQMTPGDKAAVARCIGLSPEEKEYDDSCVGIIPDPCMLPAGSNEVHRTDAKACTARAFSGWDERLQTSLKLVNAAFPALQPAIADQQSNWLKSREALCPQFAALLEDDEDCRLQETSRRALIAECLSLPRDDNGSAAACVGNLAGVCELAPGEDANACALRLLSKSKKRLQTLVKHMHLEESQSYWLKSREGLCALFDGIDQVNGHLGSDRCRLVETTGRAEVLQKLLDLARSQGVEFGG